MTVLCDSREEIQPGDMAGWEVGRYVQRKIHSYYRRYRLFRKKMHGNSAAVICTETVDRLFPRRTQAV